MFWALTKVWDAGPGIAALGTNGTGVPMGVLKALDNEINEDNNFEYMGFILCGWNLP